MEPQVKTKPVSYSDGEYQLGYIKFGYIKRLLS